MKKVIAIISLFLCFNGQAQFVLDDTQSLNWMIDSVLLGGGVTVQNATFNALTHVDSTNQIGFFDAQGVMNFPLTKGLIFATGDIQVCQGPNDGGGVTMPVENSISGDADLGMLLPGFMFNDIAVLEFDFIPSENILIYQYVFGSEEYPEFVNSGFNDAFGFFVSGPGISGPFSSPLGFPDGSMNVALIPNSSDFVSIDNINSDTNSSFYFDNNFLGDSTQAQFDGYTLEIPVAFNVVPGETYHIKMVIGDAGDSAFDSAVFIKNQSFMSVAQIPTGIEDVPLNQNFTLYPVPSQNLLNLNSEKPGLLITAVTIFDISGRRVLEKQYNSKASIQMDISSLVAGNYSISILTNEGYLTKNIVKE